MNKYVIMLACFIFYSSVNISRHLQIISYVMFNQFEIFYILQDDPLVKFTLCSKSTCNDNQNVPLKTIVQNKQIKGPWLQEKCSRLRLPDFTYSLVLVEQVWLDTCVLMISSQRVALFGDVALLRRIYPCSRKCVTMEECFEVSYMLKTCPI